MDQTTQDEPSSPSSSSEVQATAVGVRPELLETPDMFTASCVDEQLQSLSPALSLEDTLDPNIYASDATPERNDPNAKRRRLPQEAIDIMHGPSYSHCFST